MLNIITMKIKTYLKIGLSWLDKLIGLNGMIPQPVDVKDLALEMAHATPTYEWKRPPEFTSACIKQLAEETKDFPAHEMRKVALNLPMMAGSLYVANMKNMFGINVNI